MDSRANTATTAEEIELKRGAANDTTTIARRDEREQQAFIQQHLEVRDRSQVLFQGLAKKNGNLMEQAGDLSPMSESVMKRRHPKQKQQHYLKVKEEITEL